MSCEVVGMCVGYYGLLGSWGVPKCFGMRPDGFQLCEWVGFFDRVRAVENGSCGCWYILDWSICSAFAVPEKECGESSNN